MFGGEGAVIAGPAKETPLSPQPATGSSSAVASADPCAEPSPKADVALLDDFEDGDAKLFKAYQREGWWFASSDNTEGSRISPMKFAPEKLPEAEATKDNLFAAHLTATGQKDWGAVWGVTLRWESNGIRCPFNASAFAGIRFRARGPGSVRVMLGVPETQPPDGGGTCQSKCYDMHGKIVHMSNCWDEYLVRWDQLQQDGWGAQARFDPARIIQLGFSVHVADLPTDFWLDDLALVTAEQADAMAAAPAVSLSAVNASCGGSSATTTKTGPAKPGKGTHPAAPAKPATSAAPGASRPR